MRTVIALLYLVAITSYEVYTQQVIIGKEIELSKKAYRNLSQTISDYSLYEINILKSDISPTKSDNIIILELGSNRYEMNLFDNNLKVTFDAPSLPLLLSGSLTHGGTVSLTINDGFIYGFIKAGTNHFFIEPLRYFDAEAAKNAFVLYNAHDVIESSEHTCGVKETYNHTPIPQKLTSTCKIVDLAIANTADMFSKYGSTTAVTNHNLAVLNNVQTNYRSEFNSNLEYQVVAHYVPTSDSHNPLSPNTTTSDAAIVINNFRDWAQGAGQAGGGNTGGATGGFGVDYTIAELWTDRNISLNGDAGLVGLAYTPGWHHLLEDFNSNAAYLESLVTHEIGHNWSALHDAGGSNSIMAPSVTLTNNWSIASQTAINNHLNGQNYLDACSTIGSPIANFYQSSIAVCLGHTVSLEDQSQYGATRQWNLVSGTPSTSTTEKENVSYNTPGLKAIIITSANGAGSDTHRSYVDVENEPNNSCTPSGNPGAGGITSFSLSDINNISGSGALYENFICSDLASLTPQTTYLLSFSITNSGLSKFRLFCDWNNDGDYNDANESIGNYDIPGPGTYNVNVTTPASPVMETILRMRAINNSTDINSACMTPSNGQVEDYGVYFPVSQIYGCTDPVATNYNSNATVEDGSCTYNSEPCDGQNLNISAITQPTYRAEMNIQSDAVINGNQSILFTAGNEIDINPGFEINTGTVFESRIEPCNTNGTQIKTQDNKDKN